MILFYDFEVFKHDWLVVIISPSDREEYVFVNDPEGLKEFYENHKTWIWVGYNSRQYDQYILKGILCGYDPKQVSDHIIVKGLGGWLYSTLFHKIQLYNYDVMTTFNGLKTLEGFMGSNIKETSVPFDIERKLTPDEIAETIKYCRHDVEQTAEVWLANKSDFDAQMGLIKMFNLPLKYISKTKVQLSAIVLGATKRPHNDEFEISIPDTLQVEKYSHIVDWYRNPVNMDYEKKLEIDVAGVPHIFAWGGLHGAIDKYSGVGHYLMMDVASLYPSLMIEYDYQSRNIEDPNKYREIRDMRLKFKREKNPLQAPLKIVLNGTYGAMKDKHNNLYDPRQANNVCVAGQLLLLDLIEHLEPHCDIIQSNTDGILIKLRDINDYDLIDDIAYEWEQRTRLELEFDQYHKVFQKDVNNYVVVDYDGKMKSKGAYVKKLNDLDYDLPIINKAMVEYMVNGTPVEKTIGECDDLREFQKIVKVSSKYWTGQHNGRYLNDKTFRVFASKDERDGTIYKIKSPGANPEKFSNTPDRCFINNENVIGVKCPENLDKSWYIEKTYERLEQFGVVESEV